MRIGKSPLQAAEGERTSCKLFAMRQGHSKSDDDLGCFEALLAEYNGTKNLDESAINSRIAKLTEGRAERPTSSADLCELALLRLRNGNHQDLALAVTSLRAELADLTGKIPDQHPPNVADKPALLAEASLLTVQTMRYRDLQERFAAIKSSTILKVAIPLILAFPLAVLVVSRQGWRDPTVLVVMIAGACGGFVSFCRRIYSMEPGRDLLSSYRLLRADFGGLIAKPLLGGAFALCLYLLFIGKMVTGALFPTLELASEPGLTTFRKFFTATLQANDTEFAKLLVWCFIAGFAERFVPDMLDRFASKGGDLSSKNK